MPIRRPGENGRHEVQLPRSVREEGARARRRAASRGRRIGRHRRPDRRPDRRHVALAGLLRADVAARPRAARVVPGRSRRAARRARVAPRADLDDHRAGRARCDPRNGRRPARDDPPAPPGAARGRRRARAPRDADRRRRDRVDGLRRALRGVRPDQGSGQRGGRQDPGLDERRRGRRDVIDGRADEELGGRDREIPAPGRRPGHSGRDVARLLPHVHGLLDVLPAEGRPCRSAGSSTGISVSRRTSRRSSRGT